MRRLSATFQITISLVLLSSSALLVANALGIGPDETRAKLESRRRLCQMLAVESSLLVTKEDLDTLETCLTTVVRRFPDVVSVGLRTTEGRLALQAGNHETRWQADSADASLTQVLTPLVTNEGEWGTVEVCFEPVMAPGLTGILANSFIQHVVLLTIVNTVVFFLFLKKTLKHLDPSSVIPERVRNTFDTMIGGLIILDNQERIVLANKAFASAVGKLPLELQGLALSKLPWKVAPESQLAFTHPWCESLRTGVARAGVTIKLTKDSGTHKSYIVNSSPICSEDGKQRGALVSFEDVTELENKTSELDRALDLVRVSLDEIRVQNEKLQKLATMDPLTNCMNRRSFYEALETQWAGARRYGYALACVMVDIDHFKSINDQHGHKTGDLVLQKVASALRGTARTGDLVCRYGGEEFCILLPHLNADQAALAAERYRKAIAEVALLEISVTASFGVSSIETCDSAAMEMIDQADKSLYIAKRNGRNQVVRWGELPEDLEFEAEGSSGTRASASRDREAIDHSDRLDSEIPFHAVSGLIASLAFRDSQTAEHSRRVADLSVIAARGIMSAQESYVLETAALLHDIGKIGVPDSILLKPGPLTAEEWKIMSDHDRMSVDIIDSTFACPALTEIIAYHHAWYGGNPREPGLPSGEDIPLAARILAIADAYDAMLSDRVYRKGRNQVEAFAELRRCTGRQFDPQIVEGFIAAVEAQYESRSIGEVSISRRAAVLIGQQTERLAKALDNHDMQDLMTLAQSINVTATWCGELELAQAAVELHAAVESECDLSHIVDLTTKMMSLCRATQAAFLNSSVNTEQEEPVKEEKLPELSSVS